MTLLPTRIFRVLIGLFIAALIVGSCSRDTRESVTVHQAQVDDDVLLNLREEPVSFQSDVRPVLENRCMVCHGCFDAPCQLKLTSAAGIARGANPETVYDGGRISAAEPTRLFIDGKTTGDWRAKGFHPVVDEVDQENDAHTPKQNLENSVMYKMLRLKQRHPQPLVGMLSDDVDLGLNRKQVCVKEDGFEQFAAKHPKWGMPYAMPNLNKKEYDILVEWLAEGAQATDITEPSAEALPQIAEWEAFLNGSSLKQQLVSRYIYEHLFLGHIHLADTSDREFYRLIRSSTPNGQPADEIATVRPFDAPGDNLYYRLVRYPASIVAKSHVLYEFSPERIERYKKLFIEPDYEVEELPSYELALASNAFITFEDIPPNSRYRFLLDDARFFIEGFIKGPVCRGQIALNVIDDQFWVTFVDPDAKVFSESPEFLHEVAANLQLPTERGNTMALFSVWTHYWEQEQAYRAAQSEHLKNVMPRDLDDVLGYIWDGEGTNPNAALTVFRHYDSATVKYGFVGDYPETAWVIDYPLFERIHYLLVAGFDVYGNVGHQLTTRIYMDFLRMEGENNFLMFMP
ncbi:MAG: fatty acid cis/trans isomerase, partial [Gammaproteobacteria bacterium]